MPVIKIQVEELYAKDKNLKHEDVRIIQQWLQKQAHLPSLEEYQIIMFLHSCFYRIELAKTTIDKYFTAKTHHADIFDCLRDNILKSVCKYMYCGVLPKKTPEGCAILVFKFLDCNVDVFSFTHLVTLMTMTLELYMHQHGFVSGGIGVFDTKGFSFGHLTKINLNVLKCGLEHVQEGAPVRIKGMHFINVVPAMDKLKFMMKPFLKSELYNMIELHSSVDTLYEKVPLECLPQDYSGKGPSVQSLNEENMANLLDNYEYFRWHDSQRVDDTKRIGELKSSVFGLEGTFKKIEID